MKEPTHNRTLWILIGSESETTAVLRHANGQINGLYFNYNDSQYSTHMDARILVISQTCSLAEVSIPNNQSLIYITQDGCSEDLERFTSAGFKVNIHNLSKECSADDPAHTA